MSSNSQRTFSAFPSCTFLLSLSSKIPASSLSISCCNCARFSNTTSSANLDFILLISNILVTDSSDLTISCNNFLIFNSSPEQAARKLLYKISLLISSLCSESNNFSCCITNCADCFSCCCNFCCCAKLSL